MRSKGEPRKRQVGKGWRRGRVTVVGQDGMAEDAIRIVQLVPCCPFRKAVSAEDVRAQAGLLGGLGFDPDRSVALAPSGWLFDKWEPGRCRQDLSPELDAGEVLPRAVDLTMSRLGGALAKIPARLTVFGVDYYTGEDEVELQLMFVYDRDEDAIVHTTSKFSARAWSWWLCSIHDLTTHVTELPLLGSTAMLNCDDLAALKARKMALVKDKEWKRRMKKVDALIRTRKPEALVHIGHDLGTPASWRNAISEMLNRYDHIELAATSARYDRKKSKGNALATYDRLVRGATATRVALRLA